MEKKLEADIQDIKNATDIEKEAFTLAANRAIDVLNWEPFWGEVQTQWNSMIYKNKYVKGSGWTAVNFAEFKEMVMSGQDQYEDMPDGKIDILVNFYFSRKKVVGYTNPSTYWTWINRRIFSSYDTAEIGGNIIHEALHNMSFDHPGANRKSLVYQIGYLVRDNIRKKAESDLKPVPDMTPISIEDTLVIRKDWWTKFTDFFKWIF